MTTSYSRSRFLRRLAAYAVLASVAVTSPSRAQEPGGFDVFHYTAEIEPDFDTGGVQGSVSVSLRAVDPKARELVLDAGDLRISGVSERETRLGFFKDGSRLHIELAAHEADEARKVRIVYDGKPARGVRFSRELRQFSTVFATSHWMPSLDSPSARATRDLTLIVPDDVEISVHQSSLCKGQTSTARLTLGIFDTRFVKNVADNSRL